MYPVYDCYPTIDMEATGRNLWQLARSEGRSARDLGEAVGGVTNQAVYKWLNGRTVPTVDNLVILADYLQVSIEDILVIRPGSRRGNQGADYGESGAGLKAGDPLLFFRSVVGRFVKAFLRQCTVG